MPERPAPSTKPLAQKLGIKPGNSVLLLNQQEAPDLGKLPADVRLAAASESGVDAVLAFVRDRADADAQTPGALAAVTRDGLLWFAYPKKTSGIATDISRDYGWEALNAAGWEGIAMVAIDDRWSAMRFRPSELVKNSRLAR